MTLRLLKQKSYKEDELLRMANHMCQILNHNIAQAIQSLTISEYKSPYPIHHSPDSQLIESCHKRLGEFGIVTDTVEDAQDVVEM